MIIVDGVEINRTKEMVERHFMSIKKRRLLKTFIQRGNKNKPTSYLAVGRWRPETKGEYKHVQFIQK